MEYIPIRVSTLRGEQKIDFNAYIKINDKFVLYLRQGDSLDGPRLGRLRGKNLQKMYIDRNDESSYRNYLKKNIEMAYDKNSQLSMENRALVIQGTHQSCAEGVMEDPDNEVFYFEAKTSSAQFSQFISNEDSAFALIMQIENMDQNIAHHGVSVSALAITLAKKLGLTNATQLQLLSLGALLHDFGHFKSPLSIARPLKSFSASELALYKAHPNDGALAVKDKKHFDQAVTSIIAQHEEYIDGKGFPFGLTESKMDPLSVITASANALDRLITFEKNPPLEAVKKLILTSIGKYPLKHIQLLGDIMKDSKV